MALAYDLRRSTRDIRLLADHLGLHTPAEALAVCAEVFPDEPVPKRSRLLLDEVLGEEPGG